MEKGFADGMSPRNFTSAQAHLQKALRQAPDDYTGLMLMAKCQPIRKKNATAEPYLERAREIYPQEARVHFVTGYMPLGGQQDDQASGAFNTCDRRLEGHPNITFFRALSWEGLSDQKAAAQPCYKGPRMETQGDNARHDYKRLVEWGYVKI